LVFFLVFLGLGGLYGGITMLIDPSGKLIQMAEVLPALLVPDYTMPGLFLTGVMGLLPLLLAYALAARPAWIWLQRRLPWPARYWAWMASLALGVLLVLWLILQISLIGLRWPIQYVTALNALMIVALSLLAPVKRFYADHCPRPAGTGE